MIAERERLFREEAPTTAAAAATIRLDGVKADQWRIFIGKDAHRIEGLVCRSPEQALRSRLFRELRARGRLGPRPLGINGRRSFPIYPGAPSNRLGRASAHAVEQSE